MFTIIQSGHEDNSNIRKLHVLVDSDEDTNDKMVLNAYNVSDLQAQIQDFFERGLVRVIP